MNKKETVTIIRSLLSSTNSSCGIYTLNKDFREETGIDIPLFGYGSLSEFLESIPDTVKLTGVYPIQKVSLVDNDVSAHIVSLVKRQRRDKRCKKGGSVSSGGYFGKNNRYRKNNCNTVKSKKLHNKENKIPDLVEAHIPPLKDCLKLQNQKHDTASDKKSNVIQNGASVCGRNQIPPLRHHFRSKNQECISTNVQKSNGSQEMPLLTNIGPSLPLRIFDCFIGSDEKIPANDLKLNARVGHYVEVYPCEISHPGHFYLHLRELKKKLSTFMDKLQKFYNEREEIPKLNETPKVEQIAVVWYSRNGDDPRWHRVQVEEILGNCLVVVSFIDYGTTAKILVKNLKPLHRDFSSFPRQAVLGSLANVKPSGDRSEWSKSAIRRFHELAFCRDLVAGVVSMDCDAYSLNVALSSTVGEEVHINDTLVDEGFADFDANVTNNAKKSGSGKVESEQKSAASEKESDISPLFYFKTGYKNSRLQKMFNVQE